MAATECIERIDHDICADAPAVQEDDSVRLEPVDFRKVMGDDKECRRLIFEPFPNKFHSAFLLKHIKGGKGLVEEQNTGLANQGTGERQTLLLTTREGARTAPREMHEIKDLQYVIEGGAYIQS